MDTREIMDIMNITAWMAMAGAVSALVLAVCQSILTQCFFFAGYLHKWDNEEHINRAEDNL